MRIERVRTHLRDGVVDIALGDEVMTGRQCAELADLLGEYAEDRELRAVILRSESVNFCVGVDDELIMQRSYSPSPADLLAGLRVPVVAVLTGRVESAGLELALAADVRLADPSARFRLSEVSQGRLPFW